MHVYEIRPRKDKRGVDLISDALPFARLWYGDEDGQAAVESRLQFLRDVADAIGVSRVKAE